MDVDGKHYTSIWADENDKRVIKIIDQRYLPHKFVIEELKSIDDVVIAIKDMHIRGAPLIGVTAGFGMYLAALHAPEVAFDDFIEKSAEKLILTRPTAVDLAHAVNKQREVMKKGRTIDEKTKNAFENAMEFALKSAEMSRLIGEKGLVLIEELSRKKSGETVNILTHCNAGWLACVDYGTALAPIYTAFDNGIKVHVWVDETRPRNQGARLTAWELEKHGVPYTIIADNAGGHLMQHKMVDIVIVGADRVTRTGDVANKIGTYLKALAARDNNIPFYAALPTSTFDIDMESGIDEIPIEERDEDEVKHIKGLYNEEIVKVLLTPENSHAVNYSFDVTPAKLISGLITEKGIYEACEKEIIGLKI